MRTTRIGLFGIGLDAYWPQFKGLKQRLEGYLRELDRQLRQPGVEVVNLGLIDNPIKAFEAGHRFRQADVDLIFLHVTTYALSSTVLPVVRRAKVPVIILNLSPEAAIDYAAFNRMGDRTRMTGEWLAYCAACPGARDRQRLQSRADSLSQVTGMLDDDPACWNEIARVGRSGARGRRDGPQPPGRDGPLLRRHARHLFRPHPAVRQFRRAHGDGRSGRTGGAATRGNRRRKSRRRVALFPEAFDVQPDCSRGRAGARGAHVGGAGPAGRAARPGLAGLLLHGHGQRGQRGRHQLDHPRQHAADRARHSRGRRVWRSRTSRP